MASKKRQQINSKLTAITAEGRKPDKRTRDSLKRIRNAYADMLGEGADPGSISVTELAARANVDRKTFYNYYSGIYELDRAIAAEIGDAFRHAIESSPVDAAEQVPHLFFKALADILNRDMDFYGRLFRIGESSTLSRSIMAAVRSEAVRVIREKYSLEGRRLELSADFIIAGCIEVYRRWYTQDPRPRVEEYSDIVSILCFGGMNMLAKNTAPEELPGR
ncbi:MAG: TetR/AcrR family transcriptional regulator [Clostridia bacterium]|nr:TetR/AcrR family transcriptional regulator [Clostridia bacterium]